MQIEILIEECDRTLKTKEKSLGLVQKNIEQCSRELVLVKESGEMMRKSIDQYIVELEFKERRVEKLFEQIKEAAR